MKRYLSEPQKQQLVTRYLAGEAVSTIYTETGIAKSTLYSWIKQYRPIQTRAERIVTPKDYDSLLRRCEKQEQLITVLKSVNCLPSAPLQDRLIALEALYGQFSVHVLCEALDVSRGTFYNHIKRNKRSNSSYAKHREELKVLIQDIFDESRQTFGAEKICAVLHERGHAAGTKLITELMQEMGLNSVSKTAKKDWKKAYRLASKANHLKQDFHAEAPNLVWVSDVTVLRFKDNYYYLCAIIDLFSRKVIAHKLSRRNSTQLITATFRSAYESRTPGKELIFHSDQGSQYTSHAFRRLLEKLHITQSFSKPGTPHDNAVAESFFSTFKREEFYRSNYHSEKELRQRIDAYISFYNQKRPHTTLKNKTPDQFETNFILHQK